MQNSEKSALGWTCDSQRPPGNKRVLGWDRSVARLPNLNDLNDTVFASVIL
jgi:hypothetical protein